MPGLHFASRSSGFTRADKQRFQAALSGLPGYDARLLLDEEHTRLLFSAYADYPLLDFTADGCRFILEGHLYGLGDDDKRQLLRGLIPALFPQPDKQRLGDLVLGLDGDFVLLVHEEASGELRLLNDHLAHLPIYLHEGQAGLSFSRDARALLAWSGDGRPDALGLAQSVLFGYMLGDRTPFAALKRLAPMSLLEISPERGAYQVSLLRERDYSLEDFSRSREDHLDQLASLLRSATSSRARSCGAPLLSLSGGLDSRFVGGVLKAEQVDFASASFLDADGSAQADAAVAQAVARHFGSEWQRVDLSAVGRREYRDLMSIKPGLNSPGMAFILPFFEALRTRHGGGLLYLTGDGAPQGLVDGRSPLSKPDPGSMTDYIIYKHQISSLSDAAALLRLGRRELRDSVTELLESFPERDAESKNSHFRRETRLTNSIYEAEDRNRHWFWSSSPFFAAGYFECAMAVPNDHKGRFAFYRDLIERISPDIFDVPLAHPGKYVPGKLSRFKPLLIGLNRVSPQLVRSIKRRLEHWSPPAEDDLAPILIAELMQHSSGLEEIFDFGRVRAMLDHRGRHRQIEFHFLLGAMAAADLALGGGLLPDEA